MADGLPVVGSRVGLRSHGLVDAVKGRPVADVPAPAAHHQLEQRGRAEWRGGQEYLETQKEKSKAGTYTIIITATVHHYHHHTITIPSLHHYSSSPHKEHNKSLIYHPSQQNSLL